MKTTRKLPSKFFMLLLFILAVACSKDDNGGTTDPDGDLKEGQGITTDDLETYAGSIALSFSAREVVKKGHFPTKARIIVDNDTGDFSKITPIDMDTNLAILSLEVEDLDEDENSKLRNGVPVDVEMLDDNDAVLVSKSFSILSFKSNPDAQEIDDASLSDVRNTLAFKEDMPYYMQLVKENQSESKLVAYVNYVSGGTFGVPVNLRDDYEFSETDPDKSRHLFTFKRIPNDPEYFAIISGVTSQSKHLFLRIVDAYLFQDQSRFVEDTDLKTLPVDNRFKFVRDTQTGLYRISPKAKGALRKTIVDNKTRLIATSNDTYEEAYFRILTPDIDWNIEVLDTKFLTPVLPSPTSGFTETNTKLSNCTEGSLKQAFELSETKTKTSKAAFDESFSMTSRNTKTNSLTFGVSTELGFFGTGIDVSAETTSTYEEETSITSTSTKYTSEITGDERSFVATRTIEVNPGSAVYVYDATQVYNEVKVPFVQQYRIKGSYKNGQGDLTGDEIFTQFLFSNANGGVITDVGTDFINITVRGTNTIGDVLHVISRADSTDPDCN